MAAAPMRKKSIEHFGREWMAETLQTHAKACGADFSGSHRKDKKMQIEYNENDWSLLADMATELAPEFGGRVAAFKEARRRRPDLNATPPGGNPSAVVKAYEARSVKAYERAASSQGTRQAPPAPAMDAPSRSAVVRACEARVASSSQGTRQAPPVAPAAADPLERAVERLMAAADPLGTGQAPLATPAAADPLERAVARLMAAGHTSTEAPGAGDPLQQACERLGRK